MKQVKSTVADLQGIFASTLTVRYITSPLVSFDIRTDVPSVKQFMAAKDYHNIGVRDGTGLICGYAMRDSLTDGVLGDHVLPLCPSLVVDDTASIAETIRKLRKLAEQKPLPEVLFVKAFGEVAGIITKGDLRKIPVRMWLLGLVSLLEMQMLRIIADHYPDDGWQKHLSPRRLAKAKHEHDKLVDDHQQLGLVDCLQWCDKRDIIVQTPDLVSQLSCGGSKEPESLLGLAEELRNDLAHAGDFLADRWPSIVDLVDQIEQILTCAEGIQS